MIHLVPDAGPGPSAKASGEFRFVHAHDASAILGVLAVAVAGGAWTFMAEGLPRLVFTFGPALFGVHFLRASLRRYELVIDPVARSWRRRSGPFFAIRSATGSLDDLAAVALTLQHVPTGSGSGSTRMPIWSITLEFTGPDWDGTPLLIEMVEKDEAAAYRRLEQYAERLGADAIDRTALVDARSAWDAADNAAGTGHPMLAGAVPRAAPPSRTGIRLTHEEGRRRITLPPHGVDFAAVAGALVSVLLATVGVFFALEPLRALGILRPDGAVPPAPLVEVGVTLAVAGTFVVIGIKGIGAAVRRARSREFVLDLPDRLRFGVIRGGSVMEWTELPKAAIEEVALRTPEDGGVSLRVLGLRVPVGPRDSAEAALVRVRTAGDLVRIGRRLSPEGKEWLRDTIAAAARAGGLSREPRSRA